MKPNIIIVACIVFFSSVMLVAGLYLLAKFNSLFKRQIRNELLRKNVVAWLIAVCLFLSLTPTSHDFSSVIKGEKILYYLFLQIVCITVGALFVFNITQYVIKNLKQKNASFRKKMGVSLFTIIVSMMVVAFPINYIASGNFITDIEYRLIFNFYSGCMIGLVYITMNYVDLERTRKMNEKELEVSRLRELKTNHGETLKRNRVCYVSL